MHVLDHEPHRWFLLQDGDTLLLDANCNHSFVGYSVLLALDAAEAETYRREGRGALHRLADAIHDSAPILAASTSRYKPRDLTATHGAQVSAAVAAWRARAG